jgi:hypothetical protein
LAYFADKSGLFLFLHNGEFQLGYVRLHGLEILGRALDGFQFRRRFVNPAPNYCLFGKARQIADLLMWWRTIGTTKSYVNKIFTLKIAGAATMNRGGEVTWNDREMAPPFLRWRHFLTIRL